MLLRWSEELGGGGGPDNILANPDAIRETATPQGGMPPRGSGMFSPMAEDCDRLLREYLTLDADGHDYLLSYAFSQPLDSMAKGRGISRSKAHIDLQVALARFAVLVYRAKKR